MIDMNFINDLAKQFNDKLPPGVSKFKKELDKNFRAVLQSVFSKLDLVTREEFNVQIGILKKTRAKLTLLEKHVAQLEIHLPKIRSQKISK
ncbi:MAG: accessory factor UbiK family protein [Rickettsiella sp.]|nr:accessory factor UbiK family protein [Rickettsiella sp.]